MANGVQDIERVEPGGYHLDCPHCRRELRIHRKYSDCYVECKICRGRFQLSFESPRISLNAFYADCPHCAEELRVGWRYRQARVACKLCGGRIQFVPPRRRVGGPAH